MIDKRVILVKVMGQSSFSNQEVKMAQEEVRIHKVVIEFREEMIPLERDCLRDVWGMITADQRALSLFVQGTHAEAYYTDKSAEVFRCIVFDQSWADEDCLKPLFEDHVMQGLWKFHKRLTGLTFDQVMRQACSKVLSCRFEHDVPIPEWL